MDLDRAVAVVPAAGRAERFGGGKLVADVGGEPLLTHTLRSLLDAGVQRVVVVVAPAAVFSEVGLLTDPRVTVVTNLDPSRGMFSSIQTGFVAVSGSPILVLPADMPFVKSRTIARVIATAGHDHVTVATHRGRRGHPIAIPGQFREAIIAADARGSLRDALGALNVETVATEVDDPGVLKDVDTRQDLDRSTH